MKKLDYLMMLALSLQFGFLVWIVIYVLPALAEEMMK